MTAPVVDLAAYRRRGASVLRGGGRRSGWRATDWAARAAMLERWERSGLRVIDGGGAGDGQEAA